VADRRSETSGSLLLHLDQVESEIVAGLGPLGSYAVWGAGDCVAGMRSPRLRAAARAGDLRRDRRRGLGVLFGVPLRASQGARPVAEPARSLDAGVTWRYRRSGGNYPDCRRHADHRRAERSVGARTDA